MSDPGLWLDAMSGRFDELDESRKVEVIAWAGGVWVPPKQADPTPPPVTYNTRRRS